MITWHSWSLPEHFASKVFVMMQLYSGCPMAVYFGQGCAWSGHACGAAALQVRVSNGNVWVLKWHKLHAGAALCSIVEYAALLS